MESPRRFAPVKTFAVIFVPAALFSAACGRPGDGQVREGASNGQPLALHTSVLSETVADCGTSDKGAPCRVHVTTFVNGGTIYQIEQPKVNTPNYEYPISFMPGDRIYVSAGGCVQTGGGGSTWKRYVDPTGPNTQSCTCVGGWAGFLCKQWECVPRLYHGTITIPGVTPQAAHIKDWVDHEFTIPTSFGGPIALQLGYTDDADEFENNGYYDHDDGTDDQCSLPGGSPAHLTIIVNMATAPRPPIPYPYDLVADGTDRNGLDLNPRWAWQVPDHDWQPVPNYSEADLRAGLGNMTSQSTTFDAGRQVNIDVDLIVWSYHNTICPGFAGHRNWRDVTYTGTLEWVVHDGGLFGDDDYNVFLRTPWVSGIPFVAGGMANRQDRILLEFDSDETVDLFGDDQPTWWTGFHRAVDHSEAWAHSLMDGKFAIVVGLMGVDAVHDLQAANEIHPVHAMAVRVGTWVDQDQGLLKEYWTVFVRNWGDEGYCSSKQHYLNTGGNNISIPLPPSNPAIVDLAGSSFAPAADNLWTNVSGPAVWYWRQTPTDLTTKEWVYTFHLTSPDQPLISGLNFALPSWISGDMVVSWKLLPGTQGIAGLLLPPASPSVTPQAVAMPTKPTTQAAVSAPVALAAQTTTVDPDVGGEADGSKALWEFMTHEQRAVAESVYSAVAPVRPKFPSYRVPLADGSPPRPSVLPTVSEGPPLPQAVQRRNAVNSAVCVAVGGQFPGTPNICATAAPATIVTTEGGTLGKNGWLISPVTATLTPRDASGAGIDRTEYGYDPISLSRYKDPFLIAEGDNNLMYRSIDRSGNVEDLRVRPFKIDTRPPSASAATAVDGTGIAFSYSVSDPLPGSGPAGVHLIALDANYSSTVEQFSPGASGTIHVDSACTAVEYWGEDVAGNEQAPHARTTDVDGPSLTVSPESLCMWPPDHQRVLLRLGDEMRAFAKDGCDPAPTLRIVSVTSNEPDNGRGDGDTTGDATFGPSTVCIRRERSGPGRGRVYTVVIEATDASGNASRKQILVQVPHNAGAGCRPIGMPIAEGAPCE